MAVAVEAGADHHVRLVESAEQGVQVARIMLTVGIDLDDDVVVTPLREAEPRAHRTPDAQVAGQRQDRCAGPAGDTGGVIGRAVVDHKHVRVRSHLAHFFDDVADRRLFVPRRDDDEQSACTREWHVAQRMSPHRGVVVACPKSCSLTAVPRVFPRTRWATGLALIALLGLAVRLVYVLWFFRYPMVAGGDAFYYHAGANLLVEGHGFIQPTDYFQEHWTVQAAEHPPLYILYLAIPSIVGLKSVLAHQLATCLLGVATVVFMDTRAWRIVGPKTGLAAAFLAAVYPNFWANDGLVLSETLAQLTTVIVILLAYRFWERRDRASALWLGVGLGLVILSRAESVLLLVLVVVPLAVGMRSFPWRRRWVWWPPAGWQRFSSSARGWGTTSPDSSIRSRSAPGSTNLEVVQLRRRLVGSGRASGHCRV